jgi:fused signal recognition particle receptor
MDWELVYLFVGSFGMGLAGFWILRRRKPKGSSAVSKTGTEAPQAPRPAPAPTQPQASSWWSALSLTRARFSKPSAELKVSLEEAFLSTDLGVKNTQDLLAQIDWNEVKTHNPDQQHSIALARARGLLQSWISSSEAPEVWPVKAAEGPKVIWFVGVNGVGKTTSIAKLASELVGKGHKVLLAAGDTFRAAAASQLQSWAERLNIECIRGAEGADSSSVLFDAIQAGRARGVDFVLCDSAGRLHNQAQLMEALQKNKRVMEKALPGAPHEVLLVLDANTGQNMLSQARQFLQSVGVSGLVLTKLDGSARGGAVVAVSRELGLPIYRLGLGEKPKDFESFDPNAFLQAMLGSENHSSQDVDGTKRL